MYGSDIIMCVEARIVADIAYAMGGWSMDATIGEDDDKMYINTESVGFSRTKKYYGRNK